MRTPYGYILNTEMIYRQCFQPLYVVVFVAKMVNICDRMRIKFENNIVYSSLLC